MTPTPTMERDSLVARLVDKYAASIYGRIVGIPDHVIRQQFAEFADEVAALSRPEQVVKALEWAHVPGNDKLFDVWKAEHIFPNIDEYRIVHTHKGFEWHLYSVTAFETCDTLEAAKAAAQADYEQRILSALHPAPEAASAGPSETVIGDERIFPNEPFGSDTAPSPKGVSDGVRAAAKAVLDARDKWNERQEKPEFLAFSRALDDLAIALSQEPVPATAEERAASKEGA